MSTGSEMASRYLIKRLDRQTYTVEQEQGDENGFELSDITPWCALFVSILSLSLTIYQASVTMRHDRLTVLPSILLRLDPFTNGELTLTIENAGIGPAKIQDMRATYRNVQLDNVDDAPGLAMVVLKLAKQAKIMGRNLGVDARFLPAGKAIELFRVAGASEDDREKVQDELLKDLFVRVRYCSIYDDCMYACFGAGDCPKSP